MHEMSLAEGIVELVESTARREGARRVKRIFVDIGRLATVEVEALKFCFEAVAAGSLAAGATLEVREVPGAGWCPDCSHSVPLEVIYGECPRCGGVRVQPTAGTEMRVTEIEIGD